MNDHDLRIQLFRRKWTDDIRIHIVSYHPEVSNIEGFSDGRCLTCFCSVWRHSIEPNLGFRHCKGCPSQTQRPWPGDKRQPLSSLSLPRPCHVDVKWPVNEATDTTISFDDGGVTVPFMSATLVTHQPSCGSEQGKQLMYRQQQERCHLCFGSMAYEDATREHVIPDSQDGSNDYANIRLTHSGCNSRRKTKPMFEILSELKEVTIDL